ncbi:uncharacterized protein LOC110028592 [Phalaenopsis equestris]|uniref:uncharacterized protein LOC110028592 n=1 Tax=Phalaenopsis equestris TaxID=78828 RepID=UPI0009E63A2D|nr:uncharacterized protein LOC110028592 [Phalaenopsis equestris]
MEGRRAPIANGSEPAQVKIDGKRVNLVDRLELYADVFSKEDHKEILECVFRLRDLGRAGLLREKTYSEPEKWMRGNGRITIQCGCCYNFALKDGVPPEILQHDQVDLMPTILKKMIKRMVRWRVLPVDCILNSCIINIYDRGDYIPPHIDHHDFVQPFSTVSFLHECDILFGKEIVVLGPGEFRESFKILLPIGSILVLQKNGADLAKHCITGVPTRRVSVTFRG